MRRVFSFSILLIVGWLLAEKTPKVLEEIGGKVVGVTDGDTIKVLVNNETIVIRLEGIDAPESGQSYGTKAKQALSNVVFGNTVIVKKTGTDHYGRTLGIVMAGNVDANAKMVEDGWAW